MLLHSPVTTEGLANSFNGWQPDNSGLLEVAATTPDFDLARFVGAMAGSSTWEVVASTDGLVAVVKEEPSADRLDFSRKSGYFGLHTDGTTRIPEIVMLHCVDPGNDPEVFPTVFADTREMIRTMRERGQGGLMDGVIFRYNQRNGAVHRRPLIQPHPVTGEDIMNIGLTPECGLEPAEGSGISPAEADALYAELVELGQDSLSLVHHWKAGELVAYDNVAYVHGRGLSPDIQPDATRTMHRTWLSRVALNDQGRPA
jgi:hypothetical protein